MKLQRLRNKETRRYLELKYHIDIKELLKYDKNIVAAFLKFKILKLNLNSNHI